MFLHRSALLMILGCFLAVPVLLDWWLAPSAAWYRPFLIWLLLIAFCLLLDLRRGRHDV